MRAAPVILCLAASTLSGCAMLPSSPTKPTAVPVGSAQPAAAIVNDAPASPVHIAQMAPIPNPPDPVRRRAMVTRRMVQNEATDPAARVASANAAARVQPTRSAYANAAQIYGFADGALFQVYAAPGRITDIALEAGETLSGTGPVAAGDTVRWIIGDTESGSGNARRVHILVKPTAAGLQTNLVINTSRRTYHLELRATPATYMASVAWRYPEAQAAAASLERYAASTVAPEDLNFGYRISGDRPAWRPVRVFDDRRQTFIEFPQAVSQTELPPLFVSGPDGNPTQLVNYRVVGQRMIIDRVFTRAELRLGDRKAQTRVRIERVGG
jgi:P-type conjugative transfer protein TrbG